MNGIFERIGTLRLWMLFFTLPYAWLWTQASPAGDVHGTGGLLTVLNHSLLMLFYFCCADLGQARAGRMLRLQPWRSFELPDPDVLETTRAHLAVLIVAVSFVQMFVAPLIAVGSLVVLALIFVLTREMGARSMRSRYRFAEVIWPVALLLAPMALLAGRGHAALRSAMEQSDTLALQELSGTLISDAGVAATGLGALLLCAFVVLCLVRDRVHDASDGARTIATSLGRDGAVAALFFALFAAVILSNVFAAGGAWSWHVPAVLAIGVMVSLWLLAQRDEAGATGFFFVTNIAIGILLVASLT